MGNYRIGVLLSAYNGEKYIETQVESIMNQDDIDHITLLIRNDGSKDNTGKILKKLQNKYSNLVVIEGHNIGLTASFFELLDIAVNQYDFDYYSFSDQDDYWLQDKLQSAVNFLKKEDGETPVLYGCRSMIVDENLNTTGMMTQEKKKKISFFNAAIQNIVIGHNQVINKKLAEILLNKRPDFSKIYSQDLWIENVASVVGKIVFENTPHTYYRMHNNNELGYGKSKFERVFGHLKRLKKKESQKMSYQLKYFTDCFFDNLSSIEKHEMQSFFNNQVNIFKRMNYIKNSRLYRQSDGETRSFKILYLMGSYNIH